MPGVAVRAWTNTAALGSADTGGIVGFCADPAGSTNTTTNGANNLGQLVGVFTNANGNVTGFVATPTGTAVPTPAPGWPASAGGGETAGRRSEGPQAVG